MLLMGVEDFGKERFVKRTQLDILTFNDITFA